MVTISSEASDYMETRIREDQAELVAFQVIIETLKYGIREDQALLGEFEASIEALNKRIRENRARLEEGDGGLIHVDIPEGKVAVRKLSPHEYVQIGVAIHELLMKLPDGIIEIYQQGDGKVLFKI